MGEFELIRQFFWRPAHSVLLGNGDDCALIDARAGQALAVSSDMLVAGRHFLHDVAPHALGYKALAVNLSDLAAMAASPRAFTLALALPNADPLWLAEFARGLFECANQYGCELVGGDTTRGPLTISITVFGDVPPQGAVRRSGALAGDDIWVTGELGGAALALRLLQARHGNAADTLAAAPDETLRRRLEYPVPRLALALQLRGLVHAMIDLSDGLYGDLAHILDASACGALISEQLLPKPAAVAALPLDVQRQVLLGGGDDYELCFTASVAMRTEIEQVASQLNEQVTRIGNISAAAGLVVQDEANVALLAEQLSNVRGFDHFG
jgi:thiamine-monophosphate kinase